MPSSFFSHSTNLTREVSSNIYANVFECSFGMDFDELRNCQAHDVATGDVARIGTLARIGTSARIGTLAILGNDVAPR